MSFFRKFVCILVAMVSISLTSFAQQNRFIYLQTDNRQPFYVKLNKLVYSSSATGYLIIPKLTDNAYELIVGFPKNEFPEQQLSVKVEGKDAGYILKNFGEKGWGLFNLQTMAVVMATGKPAANGGNKEESNNDEFSRVLAGVVNSPDIARKQKKKQRDEKPAPPPVAIKEEIKTSSIVKVQDERTTTARTMKYVDGTDTISVVIEIPVATANLEKKKEIIDQPETTPPVKIKPENEKKEEDLQVKSAPPRNEEPKTPPTNCTKHAGEDDFLKLRKKMASRTNDFDMIADAVKSYRSRCYTTEQVRNLGALFLSNQGKYSFFDASYAYVSDPQQFISLREALTDPYFQQRFDAMIRK